MRPLKGYSLRVQANQTDPDLSSNNPISIQSDLPLVSPPGRRKVTFLWGKVLPSRASTIFHIQCWALNKNDQACKETRPNDQNPRQKPNPQ